jgi:hypothetical protein
LAISISAIWVGEMLFVFVGKTACVEVGEMVSGTAVAITDGEIQEVTKTVISRLAMNILIFIFPYYILLPKDKPNGERYPRVGGTRECHFAGTRLQPRKLPENAQTPTRRVHAMLGGDWTIS